VWIGRFAAPGQTHEAHRGLGQAEQRGRRSCQDDAVDGAFDRIRLPVVDPVLGNLVFDALAAGPQQGRVVLLLHGFPQDARMWRAQLRALAAAGYRAVAVDQRGYSPGARPGDVAAYRPAALVADTLAVADLLAGTRGARVDLVGHDWGGVVAWHVAATHPHRVRTLTVVSTPHPAALSAALASDGDQRARSSYIVLLRQPGKAERVLLEDDARRLRTMLAGTGLPAGDDYVAPMTHTEALTAALNWYRAAKREDIAGEVTVPTLYVWGEDDPALGREAAEATAGHVRGPYRFVRLPGVGHWVAETAGEQLTKLLLEHLAAGGAGEAYEAAR
jgi:pimeloyl-ACP methyl ester carboxylesterase